MDEIDRNIIGILRRNARASLSDLAIELKLSRATIRARLDKLQKSGEILGYTVILQRDTMDAPVRGITLVKIEGKGADRITSILNAMTEVAALHTTNGNWDLILELHTETLQDLDKVLNRIRKIDGIQSTETNLLLSTVRSSKNVLYSNLSNS
ncbi:Lrp/AsnC family transcriptional regulator [Pseudovibrio flavus]|uniref:Lrp/AsnC family transcriptional regulator n=1 Tax=Pseudovibrio flavus TaxID=2529854 RepID=UPI00352843A1